MYQEKKIAAVIPCYNEEVQIRKVIETMPEYIDAIVVVDDKSTDRTAEVVESYVKQSSRVVLLRHTENGGVGAGIATGYVWARDHNMDVAVVMAGDGQMLPRDLPAILDPVVRDEVDYSKGNRLLTGQAYQVIPRARYYGNAFLSLLTKIASGYWHIADSQSGYTAINAKALRTIDWRHMYPRYGQPNDLLVRLNIYNFRVRDVYIDPVYNVGEKSRLKIHKVTFPIAWLLVKRFLWRLKEKYIIRDFHPLVLFYGAGFAFMLLCLMLTIRLIVYWVIGGRIPSINALAAMFSFVSAVQFTLFAMWFDMETNKHLR